MVMKFYKKIIRSFQEIPRETTLLIHSLVGCPLKCFGCHNYQEIIENKDSQDFQTRRDIMKYLKENSNLFTVIAFSGGEFLMEDLKHIEVLFAEIKILTNLKIVVFTNGLYPEKIKYLFDKKLIDGVHLDIKLPYNLIIEPSKNDVVKKILGVKLSTTNLIKMKRSINLVAMLGSPRLSCFRTVKYPILEDGVFEAIELYVKEINELHKNSIKWTLNDFIEV